MAILSVRFLLQARTRSGTLRTGMRCATRNARNEYLLCKMSRADHEHVYAKDSVRNCLISLAMTGGVVWRETQGQKESYNEENDR